MNYVEIDFTKSCPTINTTYAGEKGEIDAVNLKVIPEEEMMSNTSVTSFFLLFATAEGTESSRSYSKAEAPFICALWEDVTNQNVVEFQLLGQNSAGSVVMKSPIVQLYIGESIDDSTIVTPGTSRDTLLNRITEMEEEIDEFEERWEDATATTTTLSENESATVSIVAEDTVTFNFGIPKGKTGTSISSIVKTSTVGLVDTYTITFSNGTTTTFTVTNGAQGQKGDKGDTGAKGDKGDKGDEGEKGDTGEKGDKGDTGAKGDKGDTGDTGATGNGIASTVLNADYTLTITFTNGTTYTTPSIRGAMGDTGNGISSVAKTGTSGLIDTYTITYTDGTTSTFTVTNGKGINNIVKTSTSGLVDTYTITFNDGTTSTYNVTNGEQGATGNGISSVAKTSTSGLVDTYTITFTDGTTTTFNITNGEDGTITSVNGKSEAHVVLDADDIAYDTNNSVEDVLTTHSQEIVNLSSSKEDKSNKVTSVSAQSTNTQYPSAKCVYDGMDYLYKEEMLTRALTKGTAWVESLQNTPCYTRSVPKGSKACGINRIGGKTIKWNQLVKVSASSKSTTVNGVTITDNRDGTYTFNGTATNNGSFNIEYNKSFINSHKYLILGIENGSTSTIELDWNGNELSSLIYFNPSIITASANGQGNLYYYFYTGATFSNRVFKPQIFDLTYHYGAGNEPTTVAEFKSVFTSEMYPYDAGSLKSMPINNIKSVGKNLFSTSELKQMFVDGLTGETVSGDILSWNCSTVNDGVNLTKDFVFKANTQYTFMFYGRCLNSSYAYTNMKIIYTDNTFMNLSFTTANADSYSVTTSAAGKTISKFVTDWGSVGTRLDMSKCSICEGTSFVPYVGTNKPLPAALLTYLADKGYGDSAGSAYNYIDWENKKYVRCVGSLDMGTLNWQLSYRPTTPETPYFRVQASNVKSSPLNILCVKYQTSSSPYSIDDKTINMTGYNWSGEINVFDSSYSTALEFKTAMSGIVAFCELATPIEYDISSYLDDQSIEIESQGTLTFENTNGDGYRVPVPNEELFLVNVYESTN